MESPQKNKAKKLHSLHHSGKMLILPNIWDTLGAAMLENNGYQAIATASGAIAFTNGYDDGENIPLEDLLSLLKKIVNSVSVPVTADIENAYADDDADLEKNIRLFLETGIAGINIEETNSKTNSLYSVQTQSDRIRRIRDVSNEYDVPLFINARTDVLLHGVIYSSSEEKLDEIIRRGLAYKEAGADCFYPITLRQQSEIEKLIAQVKMPVNILTIPGVPDLKTMSKMGVTRVSLGPGFLKTAIKAMKDLSLQLQNLDGLSAIVDNDVTSDYLKKLVSPQN